ncbi:MAG: hypothetical protein ACI8V4_000564 [Ilumatobacter sp.]|jgi:hypothetical protein
MGCRIGRNHPVEQSDQVRIAQRVHVKTFVADQTRANGHLHTIRADGTIMLSVGARPPDLGLEHIEHFELDVLSGFPAPLSSIDDFWSRIADNVSATTGFELAIASSN